MVTIKTAEGYAHYAVYPELYAEAARGMDAPPVVIGLRSIGLGLACMVAAACGAEPPVTLRPVGHPFRGPCGSLPRSKTSPPAPGPAVVPTRTSTRRGSDASTGSRRRRERAF